VEPKSINNTSETATYFFILYLLILVNEQRIFFALSRYIVDFADFPLSDISLDLYLFSSSTSLFYLLLLLAYA